MNASPKRLSACFLALAGLIAGGNSEAIVGGEPDGRRHPFVGVIAYQLQQGGPWYVPPGGNAVLVSPRVAVTAGHVLEVPLTRDFLGVDPYRIGVVFAPRPVDPTAPFDLAVFWEVPADLVHVAKEVAWHPDLFTSPDAPNDIGVIIFEHPVKGRPKAQFLRPGLFDLLDKVLEPRLDLVGYGATEFACCPPPGGGNRYSGTAPIVDLTSEEVITGMIAEGDANAAPGDSGGAALFGHNLLIGVFSSFDEPLGPDLLPFSRFQRTDSPSACAFLSKYLRMNCEPIGP